MNNMTATELAERLSLTRHPEGGWYRETYRSAANIQASALPRRFTGDRSISTAILFLLGKGDFSALHRIKSDEIWHFYAGTSLTVHIITPEGEHKKLLLGGNMEAGEIFQAVVPAGCWFGAEVTGEGGYALAGCTVAPGFDFADFEMGSYQELVNSYPEHKELICRLTRR